ncbi:MAG: EAL domain-containing protein, partial [Gammaproteobacteria bacterium]
TQQVTQVLAESYLSAERLELEVTESAIMHEPDKAIRDMAGFRAMGVKLAVDDFGTGYSSLAYLNRLPLDRLKIDRSFVQDIGEDPGDEAICRAVINLARSLGLETVAEGVEREEQARFLRKEGCDIGQGYLYSKPITAAELFEQWRGKDVLDIARG